MCRKNSLEVRINLSFYLLPEEDKLYRFHAPLKRIQGLF